MRAVQRPHCFQFNQDGAFDKKINKILADHGSLVSNRNPALLFDGKAPLRISSASAFS